MRGNHAKTYRIAAIVGAGLIASALAHSASAACRYTVTNHWGSGFTAAIRITNDTSATVNGWQVNWSYNKNSVASSQQHLFIRLRPVY